MKSSRGFCLVQELMCLCMTAVLLTMAVRCLYQAAATVQQSWQLRECVLAAQQAAAGEKYSGQAQLQQKKLQMQELAILEVQASYGKAKYTLIQAQPESAGVSAAGAGVGVYGGSGDTDAGL